MKDWEFLPYGTGISGGTSGVPNDSHLINDDPRGFGLNAFNHHLESPHPEIVDSSNTIIEMLNRQEAETDTEARAEIQSWILDDRWCN